MFEHEWAKIPKLQRVDGENQRLYTDGEVSYPSITTVLSATADKSSLYEWKRRVGEEQANKISQAATRRGTAMHTLCEKYLLNEIAEDKENPDAMLLFQNIKPLLDKITTVKALETGLFSHKLRVAGTVDCIADYDGKLTVIDFKTSAKEKKSEWISDYFIQACFYFWAFYEQTGEMPEQIAILISSPAAVQEFIVPKKDIPGWSDLLVDKIDVYEEMQNVNNTAAS